MYYYLLRLDVGFFFFLLLPSFCSTPKAMEILGRSEGKGGRATHPAGSPLLPLFLPLSSCKAGEHVSVAAGLNAVQGNIFILLLHNIYTYAHTDLCVTAGLPLRATARVPPCPPALRGAGGRRWPGPPYNPGTGLRSRSPPPAPCPAAAAAREARLSASAWRLPDAAGPLRSFAYWEHDNQWRARGGARRGGTRGWGQPLSARRRGRARGDTRRSPPAARPVAVSRCRVPGPCFGRTRGVRAPPQPGQAPCAEWGDGRRPGESENQIACNRILKYKYQNSLALTDRG